MNLFSFPQLIIPGSTATVTGYNITVSRAVSGAPNPFGTWTALSGYTNTTQNTDIVDPSGTQNDLYRVTPIISINNTSYTFDTATSRPFFATQPLYDIQISALLDAFRQGFVTDMPIPLTDSTLPTESTGTNAMPFMTDALTTRFFLSFLQNENPVKVQAESVLVYLGADKASAAPLVQYQDFYVSENGGYIDFKNAPAANYYLRVEYNKVRNTNDQLRNILLNSISAFSLFGLTGYQVNQSNNLFYLATPLPNRDLGEILMMIAAKKLVDQEIEYNLEAAESWKDGVVSWSNDPGRALQSAQAFGSDYEDQIRRRMNNFIYQTRQYYSRGEYESYWDCSGVLPVYSIIVAGASLGGALGWWL